MLAARACVLERGTRASLTRASSKIASRKLLSRPVRKLKDKWIGLLLIKNSPGELFSKLQIDITV